MTAGAKTGRSGIVGLRRSGASDNMAGADLPVLDARWARIATLHADEKRVLRETLLILAGGHGPTAAELARRTRLPDERVREALTGLDAHDLVVLKEDRVVVAYPFTVQEVPHQVVSSLGVGRTCCAIDALGVGAMLNETIEIHSHCSRCGAPLHLRGNERFQGTRERPVVSIPSMEAVQGKVIDCLCPAINFYCSEDHGRAHLAESGGRGSLASLDDATAIGIAAFGKLLDLLK